MTIGIDIDGVLTDLEQFQLDYGSKYMWENFQKGILHPEKPEIDEIFEINDEVYYDFWKKYLLDYAKTYPARTYAGEVIQKLKEEGNIIIIITARYSMTPDDPTGEEMHNIVKLWLKENKIPYDNIVFVTGDKLETCFKNNVDIMIEDSTKNIQSISTQIPVICMDARYNKDCIGKNIIRCYSWYDIYEKIQKWN